MFTILCAIIKTMNITNLRLPLWIDQEASFKTMIQDLKQSPIIAVDTESNSLFAYQEQVCLIQFSTADNDYLVDPLAIQDMSPLGVVFANPDIEKVFHAAEYDIFCLKRDFHFEFNNLFDTMVAARILGREHQGLGGVIKDLYGIELEKKYQRANWGMRPLKPGMLEYARFDTYFLINVRNQFRADLQEIDRWQLAQEDFARLCRISAPQNNGEKERCWKVLGSNKFRPEQLAVLQALCAYREKRAKAVDLPVFKVLNNKTLLSIAKAMPETQQDMEQIPDLSIKLAKRIGPKLLRIVNNGRKQQPYKRSTNHKRLDPILAARVESLRMWRKNTALDIGVQSDVILPREVMYAIVIADPGNMKELQPVLANFPWRYEQYGDQILRTLQETVIKKK
jgi:ribonuclease D